MAFFVADASVTLTWAFEDESTPWTDALLDRLLAGDGIVVPAHWPTEVSNGLLMAVRKNRIQLSAVDSFLDKVSMLGIEVEPPLSPLQAKANLSICIRHHLTVYDAAYLELAKRRGLELATLDDDLRRAAAAEGVPTLP